MEYWAVEPLIVLVASTSLIVTVVETFRLTMTIDRLARGFEGDAAIIDGGACGGASARA